MYGAQDGSDGRERVMQNQYFGDVGDFAKFGLLRCIVSAFTPAAKLGVLWYLTPDRFGNENDGKHASYLERPGVYRDLDPELFDLLKRARTRNTTRSVAVLEESGLLGDASFVREVVPSPPERLRWFQAATARVRDTDVVFVDPDNGIETRSPNQKHVLWSELHALLDVGHPRSLVVYQHQDRSALGEGEDFPQRYVDECAARFPSMAASIALRARRGTVRAFITVVHPRHEAAIREALDRFLAAWGAGRERERIFEPRLVTRSDRTARTASSPSKALVSALAKGVGCYCGCGGATKSFFVPGHDAKVKASLKERGIYDGSKSIAEQAVSSGFRPRPR